MFIKKTNKRTRERIVKEIDVKKNMLINLIINNSLYRLKYFSIVKKYKLRVVK